MTLGGHTYYAGTQFADQTFEITFDGTTRKLTCLPEKGTAVLRVDAQGLDKSTLMGNTSALPGYVSYQLALPFTYPDMTF